LLVPNPYILNNPLILLNYSEIKVIRAVVMAIVFMLIGILVTRLYGEREIGL
jgi:hypothetical protein